MKRSLERRLAALEARKSGGGRAGVLMARLDAATALLSDDELMKEILIMQGDLSGEKTLFERIFSDAVLCTLSDKERAWLDAQFNAGQAGDEG